MDKEEFPDRANNSNAQNFLVTLDGEQTSLTSKEVAYILLVLNCRMTFHLLILTQTNAEEMWLVEVPRSYLLLSTLFGHKIYSLFDQTTVIHRSSPF